MSKREVSLYIVDIFIAINKIQRYTEKFKDAESFKWSELEWDATLRELEIIGEATNTLIKLEVLQNQKHRKIVDFRNIIIHGYFGIDEDEVWNVIKEQLLSFSKELKSIMIDKKIDIDEAILCAKEENYKNLELLKFLNNFSNELKNFKLS